MSINPTNILSETWVRVENNVTSCSRCSWFGRRICDGSIFGKTTVDRNLNCFNTIRTGVSQFFIRNNWTIKSGGTVIVTINCNTLSNRYRIKDSIKSCTSSRSILVSTSYSRNRNVESGFSAILCIDDFITNIEVTSIIHTSVNNCTTIRCL